MQLTGEQKIHCILHQLGWYIDREDIVSSSLPCTYHWLQGVLSVDTLQNTGGFLQHPLDKPSFPCTLQHAVYVLLVRYYERDNSLFNCCCCNCHQLCSADVHNTCVVPTTATRVGDESFWLLVHGFGSVYHQKYDSQTLRWANSDHYWEHICSGTTEKVAQ